MSDITKKQFVLRLPTELVDEIDARAQEKGLSRNQWFERASRFALEYKRSGIKIVPSK